MVLVRILSKYLWIVIRFLLELEDLEGIPNTGKPISTKSTGGQVSYKRNRSQQITREIIAQEGSYLNKDSKRRNANSFIT